MISISEWLLQRAILAGNRTQVRPASISDLGFLSTIDDVELAVQISPFVLWFSQAFQQIFNPHSTIPIPQSSTLFAVAAGNWRNIRAKASWYAKCI